MDKKRLKKIAQTLSAQPRGILAADESTGTIGKRFEQISLKSTEKTRRDYRETLLRTPSLGKFISGVILYDETIRQRCADNTPIVKIIRNQNIIPGIKVDTGAKDLAGSKKEKITEGLDGLRERLIEYRAIGAGFAKWRSVISIGNGIPTDYCLKTNVHALARYAALCQECGLVPIVEPEVLMDGSHTIDRCFEVTYKTLSLLYAELHLHGIFLEGTLLKPNMVISGKDCKRQASTEEVATKTIKCLKSSVPRSVTGVAFLSGGQEDEVATVHLNAMNTIGNLPWNLSF
ncbi:MAG: class I fructose-bisphosphate aldolase, partial [Pseudomonadota bacterium]|nr:class I fructose-bisphosphate aldolase [Pseudomonadota bacterium]